MSSLSILRIIFIVYLLLSRINVFGYNLHGLSVTIPMSIFALFTILLYIKKYYGNYKKLLNKYVIISFLFIVLCVLTSYINVGRIPFFNVVSNIIIFYLLFFIGDDDVKVESNIVFSILCHSISIVSLTTILFAFLEQIGFSMFGLTSYYQNTRLIGLIRYYDTPNGVAIMAFIGIAISFIKFVENKILYSIYTISGLLVVFLSDSRSTILSLILVVFLVFLIKLFLAKSIAVNSNINLKYVVIVILVMILLVFMLINGKRIESSFVAQDNNNLKIILDKLTNYRFSMYSEAFFLGCKSPIIGNGLNTFVQNSISHFGDKSYAAVFTGENPHNIFLSLFYYTGILGTTCISYLFYKIIKKSLIRIHDNFQLFVGCFSIVVGVLFYSILDVNILFHIQVSGYIFWLVSGYIFNDKLL